MSRKRFVRMHDEHGLPRRIGLPKRHLRALVRRDARLPRWLLLERNVFAR
jgi:hypothetical protein